MWVICVSLRLDYARCMIKNRWRSLDALLTLCWCSVDALLTLCWCSVDALLTLCWRSVDALLTLCWRSFSGCGWAHENPCFAYQGGHYADNEPWHTNVNTLRLAVAYLNGTINVKPKMQNRRLNLTGQAKPGKTRRLTGTGPDLAPQESAGRVFGQVWNRTDPFLRSKPGRLAGYPGPLLTLHTTSCSLLAKTSTNSEFSIGHKLSMKIYTLIDAFLLQVWLTSG